MKALYVPLRLEKYSLWVRLNIDLKFQIRLSFQIVSYCILIWLQIDVSAICAYVYSFIYFYGCTFAKSLRVYKSYF